ncbi:MAG TPA: hypothetical protein DCY25_06615 [Bacteroidales bacterium]|nr:hypothetical protein [Bacteroidales bacterium]
MIKSIHIKNFKSVVDLNLDLGRFNILVGENGCGKSNILEAIAFGAAASANKLDFEFLGSRGIRITNPEFVFSAFDINDKKPRNIRIVFNTDDDLFKSVSYNLTNAPDNPKKWINVSKEVEATQSGENLSTILFQKDERKREKDLNQLFKGNRLYISEIEKFADEILKVTKEKGQEEDSINFFKYIFSLFLNDRFSNPVISNFVIYSPEQSSIRKFEETTQLYPLGIRGEGLFQYLKELETGNDFSLVLNEIKENLQLLDWFENFIIPSDLLKNEFTLKIKDKYLSPSLQYFDQRSTNEGFLYLLFYSTLFISQATPVFFAIDNIDSALNPKLCIELTRNLSELAKRHNKQVILTTQNPAVLDGLDLSNDDHRLFVVRRNDEGHTKLNRIEYKSERRLKLSEIWLNGYIGGLPENF